MCVFAFVRKAFRTDETVSVTFFHMHHHLLFDWAHWDCNVVFFGGFRDCFLGNSKYIVCMVAVRGGVETNTEENCRAFSRIIAYEREKNAHDRKTKYPLLSINFKWIYTIEVINGMKRKKISCSLKSDYCTLFQVISWCCAIWLNRKIWLKWVRFFLRARFIRVLI